MSDVEPDHQTSDFFIADDTAQFFDVDGAGAGDRMGNDGGVGTPLTEEEKEQLRQELKKVSI